ncbi:MAG TPA: hypothetical protein VM599_01465 [Thermoanaerobaculia bacterium]|nr:hypothetical protein [Thermoanaerobaculia bacterium]
MARPDRITLFLFVVYCLEIGLFLVFAPWTVLWDRTLGQLPSQLLRTVALHPALRAGITGFGLVHLIWGVHDLTLLLSRREP